MSKIIRDSYPKSSMVKVQVNIESADGEKVFVENKKSKTEKPNEYVQYKNMTEDKKIVLVWSTSLFRNTKDENYILPIKKDVRKKLGICAGEVLEIKITLNNLV